MIVKGAPALDTLTRWPQVDLNIDLDLGHYEANSNDW